MRHYPASTKHCHFATIALWFFVLPALSWPWACQAQEPAATFTIKSSIEYALKHSTQILSSKEGVAAAKANKKKHFSEFLPKLSASYTYTRLDEEKTPYLNIVTRSQNLYTFMATLDQPVFSGFSKVTEYQISALGLDIQRLVQLQTRRDLILNVKKAYFELLQMEKLHRVAQQAATQLAAHAEVARNFYDVGMTPRNDLLKAQVELANAKQDLVVATNNVHLAKSRFNTLLRRPIDAPVSIEDVMTYEPFTNAYEDCVETALRQRAQIQLAALEAEKAGKDVKLTRKDYYPSIDLRANYYRRGDSEELDGGEGIYYTQEWDVTAIASWTLWEWGKTHYGVKEKLHRLTQATLNRTQIMDNIRQEVKEAYLKVNESENNILAVHKAVEQARENLRMSEERYKEQVATSTEVLDAQTLLTKTQTNYFNALSAFNISKAELDRATGVQFLQ